MKILYIILVVILSLTVGALSCCVYIQEVRIQELYTLSAEQDVRLTQQRLALEIMLQWLELLTEEVNHALYLLEERQDVPEDRKQPPDGLQLREIPHRRDSL